MSGGEARGSQDEAGAVASRGVGGGRWLVVGARGFLGGAVVAHLAASGRPWIGTSRARPDTPDTASWRTLDLLRADDLRRRLAELRPRYVMLAAGPAPGADEDELRRVHRVGVENALAAVEEWGVAGGSPCRIVVVGSAAEYGAAPGGADLDEEAVPRPVSAYGRVKAEASASCLAARERGVDVVVTRVFNTIGPGQGRQQPAGSFLDRLAGGERPLRVRDGRLVRDWTDVRDVARALVLVAETAAVPAIVNVCSGRGRRLSTVAHRLAALAGATVELEPEAAGPLGRSVGVPCRLFAMGFAPRIPFDRSLADQWRAAGSPHG